MEFPIGPRLFSFMAAPATLPPTAPLTASIIMLVISIGFFLLVDALCARVRESAKQMQLPMGLWSHEGFSRGIVGTFVLLSVAILFSGKLFHELKPPGALLRRRIAYFVMSSESRDISYYFSEKKIEIPRLRSE
jgi:hypothetical protein